MDFTHATEEITLPTGAVATVREFIGSDEDILSNQRYHKQNKTFEYLLKAIVQEVDGVPPTHEVLTGLYSADRAALLIAARALSFGNEVKGVHKCDNTTSCGEEFEVTVDLETLPYSPAPESLELTVTLPSGMVVTFRPLRGKDEARFIAARKDGDMLTTMILARLVKVDKPDGTELSSAMWRNWLQKGSVRDRNAIREKLKDLDFGYETVVNTSCPYCGEDNEMELMSLMGFFFPSM